MRGRAGRVESSRCDFKDDSQTPTADTTGDREASCVPGGVSVRSGPAPTEVDRIPWVPRRTGVTDPHSPLPPRLVFSSLQCPLLRPSSVQGPFPLRARSHRRALSPKTLYLVGTGLECPVQGDGGGPVSSRTPESTRVHPWPSSIHLSSVQSPLPPWCQSLLSPLHGFLRIRYPPGGPVGKE